MCNSRLKVAVCALVLFILACTLSHCKMGKKSAAVAKASKVAQVDTNRLDLDHDGIIDSKDDDIDGDGLSNRQEEAINSDPFNKDTDGDGKLDGSEGLKDSDHDGFLDILESAISDRDHDGVVDELDSDDANANNDSDGDGFSNIAEKRAHTNPLDPNSKPAPQDTDKDGKPDKVEKGKDTDKDGKSNVVESAILDHDSDGVPDELDSEDDNPNNDSDGDGYSNIDEKNAKTNPLDVKSQPVSQESNSTEVNRTMPANESNATAKESAQNSEESNRTFSNIKSAAADKADNAAEASASDANSTEANTTTVANESSTIKANRSEANSTESNATASVSKSNETVVSKEQEVVIEKQIDSILSVENINFEVDSATITPKGVATIKKIYAILKKYPNTKVQINGYTDSDGDAKYNKQLSQERVDMVKKALIQFGLNGDNFTTKGYGEENPLVPNSSIENRAKNRRVEFIIIGE